MSERIDTYTFVKTFGNQTKRKFAEVRLMQHKISGKYVIFKIVKKNEHTTLQQERLRHEANFSFDENGLPKTIDFIEIDDCFILIKEHLPGIPLDQFWDSVSSRKHNALLLQLIEALIPIFTTLKTKKIVHCDIKPGNIIVHQLEGKISLGIIDFGMAIQLDKPEERKVLFPLGYAAPELVLNKLNLVDHRTDLYSLGIVIWRLFVGSIPLTHPNPSIMTNLQITHPLPDSSELPNGLINLLQKMCFKHVFRNSPNQLTDLQVTRFLTEGILGRYEILDEFHKDLLAQMKPRKWFGLI